MVGTVDWGTFGRLGLDGCLFVEVMVVMCVRRDGCQRNQ